MKILHVLASNRFSGAENVVCQIVDMFRGDEDTEMIYCSPNGQIAEALKDRNVPFAPLKKLSVKELKRVIKEQKPDLVHAHDFRTSIISTKATKKLPIISHIHNNTPWLKSYGLKSILYATTCKKYDKIITVSDSVFDEFVFGERYKYKLTILGNPVNTKFIKEKAETEKGDCYDIVFCGRLTPQKNPFFLLDVVANVTNEIPELRVAIVGDGELREEFERKIVKKSLVNNITLFGFQKNPYSIIKGGRLLLLPSLWEGFGLVAVEALALGVPVVCSNVGGLPSIVDDSCGKICVKSEEYVEEAVKLITQDDYFSKKSTAASFKAERLDNYEKYKAKLKEIYGRNENR